MRMISLLVMMLVLPVAVAMAAEKADLVLVNKTKARLYLVRRHKVLASFHVAFGANPRGHKQCEGDQRTPEGRYLLDFKKPDSAFHKAIHISYPNARDIARARRRGVNAGGAIMIHGQKNGLGWLAPITQRTNWTDGCIALTNEDMDAVWTAVEPGTPIEIRP